MAGENGKPMEAHRLVLRVGSVVGVAGTFLTLVSVASQQFSSVKETGRAVLAAIQERPTSAEVKSEMLQVVAPIREAIVEVKAELRALADRVQRLENGNK